MGVRELKVTAILQDVTNGFESTGLVVHESQMAPYNYDSIFTSLARTACLLPNDMRLTIWVTAIERDLNAT